MQERVDIKVGSALPTIRIVPNLPVWDLLGYGVSLDPWRMPCAPGRRAVCGGLRRKETYLIDMFTGLW